MDSVSRSLSVYQSWSRFLDVDILVNEQDSSNVLLLFIFVSLFHFSKEQIHCKGNWNKLWVIKSTITINLSNFRIFWIEKLLHNIAQKKEGNN